MPTQPTKAPSKRADPSDKAIVIAGDMVTDILLPHEGKQLLSFSKETESDEPFSKYAPFRLKGGISRIKEILSWQDVPEEKILMVEATGLESTNETFWGLKSCTRDLFENNKQSVYRVVERYPHPVATQFDVPLFPSYHSREESLKGKIVIIADYGFGAASSGKWEQYKSFLKGNYDVDGKVKKIVLLGSKLPDPIKTGNIEGAPNLWKYILDDSGGAPNKQDTVVITSIDRLRQEGAKISRRKSWDQTLSDFTKALDNFAPLRRLAEFGHLVVRAGISGAFYHRRNSTGSCELIFIYDPNAKGGIFRDTISQGSCFGTRALMVSTIAAEVYNSDVHDSACILRGISVAIKGSEVLYKEGFGQDISRIKLYPHQAKILYANALSKKFGDKFLHCTKSNPQDPPLDDLSDSWGIVTQNLRAGISIEDKMLTDDHWRLQEIRRLRCAVSIVVSGITNVTNRNDSPSYLASPKGKEESISYFLKIERLLIRLYFEKRIHIESEFRGLFSFLKLELERFKEFDQAASGDVEYFAGIYEKSLISLSLWHNITKILEDENFSVEELEGEIDLLVIQCFAALDTGEVGADYRATHSGSSLTAEKLTARLEKKIDDWGCPMNQAIEQALAFDCSLSVPFNFPIGRYGKLTVAGKNDVEAFNEIRNRMLDHIQKGSDAPLSLAVFGSPGNGKSFGIAQIADEIGYGLFKEITCNLSQGRGPEYLNKVFIQIADALAKKKIPLVFFDEFDSVLPGDTSYSWLKYFLQPMQDGFFSHPEGILGVGNSVFIFIGGTHSTYKSFSAAASFVKKYPFEPRAKELTQLKLPDFTSRLKGFVDIPHINAKKSPANSDIPATGEDGRPGKRNETIMNEADPRKADEAELPYLRRAILLRSMLERKGIIRAFEFVNAKGVKDGKAMIDMDVIRAFLMVESYKHGARSMNAILDGCLPFYNLIAKAGLPNADQLDIHTDGEEFEKLAHSWVSFEEVKSGKMTKDAIEAAEKTWGDFDKRLMATYTPIEVKTSKSAISGEAETVEKSVDIN